MLTGSKSNNKDNQPEQEEKVNSGGKTVENAVGKEIREAYNSICKSLIPAMRLGKKRRTLIRDRLKEGYTVDDLKRAFEMAEASPWLRGEIKKNFQADFEWILDEDHLPKILEGKYKDRSEPRQPPPSDVSPDFLALFHEIGGE